MRGGRRHPFRRVVAVTVAVMLISAACGAEEVQVADGADRERPARPAMTLVRMEDVAADVGLDFRHGAFQWETSGDPAAMMGGGLCWIDYNRDGWLDLYAVNTWSNGEWGRWRAEGELPASRLYRNDVGRFVDVSVETGALLETRGNGCVAADLDLDGWADLFVTTDREDVLLWNSGGEGFVDDASLAVPSGGATFGWHAGAAVGDVDGNGWPDVFVAGYVDINRRIESASKGFPNTHVAEPDLLLLNDGPGDGARVRFRERALDAGIEPRGPDYGLGAALSDLDRDGDLDLLVARDTTPNHLYENVSPGDGSIATFVELGVAAGVGDDGAGMGVASGDADGDARADLVVTNQLDEHHAVGYNRSASELRFVDGRTAMELPELGAGLTGWGVSWADLDLDTDLDLVVAHGAIPIRDLRADREPVLVLENRSAERGPGVFGDASDAVGADRLGPFLGRGLAAADYDNDGDVDVAIGTIGGDIALLRNRGAGGNWLIVATPAPAPGVVVSVSRADGTVLRRELAAGSSYLSSEDPRALFGLGDESTRVDVTLALPDGSVLTRAGVAPNQILTLDPADAS